MAVTAAQVKNKTKSPLIDTREWVSPALSSASDHFLQWAGVVQLTQRHQSIHSMWTIPLHNMIHEWSSVSGFSVQTRSIDRGALIRTEIPHGVRIDLIEDQMCSRNHIYLLEIKRPYYPLFLNLD